VDQDKRLKTARTEIGFGWMWKLLIVYFQGWVWQRNRREEEEGDSVVATIWGSDLRKWMWKQECDEEVLKAKWCDFRNRSGWRRSERRREALAQLSQVAKLAQDAQLTELMKRN
jgi:hypothetical protein